MRIVSLAALVYFLIHSWLSIHRVDCGAAATYDLGIHDQATWLVYHGLNPFMNSRGLQMQADHFSPIAYFLAPLFAIWDDPRMLLLAQAAWLACGAFPVYGIALHHLEDKRLSQGLAILYLLQPCLGFANQFDFHFSTLMFTPLLWACYALDKRDPLRFYLALLTAMACSETAAYSLLGLVPLVWQRLRWRHALVTLALAVGAVWVTQASLRWHNHGHSTQYTHLYSEYGKSSGEVLATVVRHPWQTAARLNTEKNRKYIRELFGPLLLTPLLGPLELVPALPVFAGNLLSWRDSQHSIDFHYTAGILPFLMWSSCAGWARLRRRLPARVCGWLVVLAGVIGLLVGPLHPEEYPPIQVHREEVVRVLRRLIPAQASVSAENNLGGTLNHRRFAYLFPNPMLPAAWGGKPQALVDQTVMGLDAPTPGTWRRALERLPVEYIVIEPGLNGEFPVLKPDRAYLAGEMAAFTGYRLIYADNGAVVFAQGEGQRFAPRRLPVSSWFGWREHLTGKRKPRQ